MANPNYPIQSCRDVMAELDDIDYKRLSAKSALAFKLNELIEKRNLSQTEVATITGMSQPKVSQVRRYKLQNISLERLMLALVSLGQHVEIVVHSTQDFQRANLTVAT